MISNSLQAKTICFGHTIETIGRWVGATRNVKVIMFNNIGQDNNIDVDSTLIVNWYVSDGLYVQFIVH